MSAVVHTLTQGSKEWLDYRQGYFNASEASAMLGLSPYKSRDALLQEKATDSSPVVSESTQHIFDEGHRLEAQALTVAQEIVEEGLYQPTMSLDIDDIQLSASFDGLTLMNDVVWEHKTLSASLRENLQNNIIPEQYKPQLEQQMLISGAESCLFMASNDEEEYHLWYASEPLLRKRLIAGWKQFAEDLKNWKPVEVVEELKVSDIEQLPALNVQISGGVTRSNMEAYKNTALQFIAAINTDLQTDQDFADADAMVKFCGKTEKELEAVKEAALSQTADIDELFKTISTLKAEMRTKRLELDKLVKSRKAAIKDEIIGAGKQQLADFIMSKNSNVPQGVCISINDADFTGVAKNKRTVESLNNAVNTELARCKIEVNEIADHITDNMKLLADLFDNEGNYDFLFRDIQSIITESGNAFMAIARTRIADQKSAEEAKLEAERERIRKEEQAKAEAKARAEEAIRIRKEEAIRIRKEEAIMEKECNRIMAENVRPYDNEISEEPKADESKPAQKESPILHGLDRVRGAKKADDFNDYQHVKGKKKPSNQDSDFDKWWNIEGSGFTPYASEDMEEFAERIARIAWSNGQFCANRNIEYGSPRAG